MDRIRRFGSKLGRAVPRPLAGQSGFTLIELLVVVIILGVLAAVVITNVSRFAGRGQVEAQNTELTNVQLAIDAMITENRWGQVVPRAGGVGATAIWDFSAATSVQGCLDPVAACVALAATAFPLFPNWMRHQFAMGGDLVSADVAYCWDGTGLVVQVIGSATVCP